MARRHHRLNGHDFEHTLRNSEGQATVHGSAKRQIRLSD